MLTGVFDPIIHGKLMSMLMWHGKSLEFVPIDAERSGKECSRGQKKRFLTRLVMIQTVFMRTNYIGRNSGLHDKWNDRHAALNGLHSSKPSNSFNCFSNSLM